MRFTLYILIGAFSWLVDVAVYQAFWALIGIAAAQFIARIAGAVTAFLLNRSGTFSAGKDAAGIGVQAAKYSALLVLNWVVTVGLIYILNFGLGVHPLNAKIVVDIIIVPSNYLVMKYWVFPKPVNEVEK